MSRIGKQFIAVPKQVNIKLNGQKIVVDGPKGSLSRILPSLICCTFDETEGKLFLEKAQDTKLSQALYGLSRTLVANMVTGVSTGFQKKLALESWIADSRPLTWTCPKAPIKGLDVRAHTKFPKMLVATPLAGLKEKMMPASGSQAHMEVRAGPGERDQAHSAGVTARFARVA